MVIHFLQAGVRPPVLPSLQVLYPQVFGCMASIANLSFLGDLPTYESQNKMTLGKVSFSFNKGNLNLTIISVTEGRLR